MTSVRAPSEAEYCFIFFFEIGDPKCGIQLSFRAWLEATHDSAQQVDG
jgi:hypothetical protein